VAVSTQRELWRVVRKILEAIGPPEKTKFEVTGWIRREITSLAHDDRLFEDQEESHNAAKYIREIGERYPGQFDEEIRKLRDTADGVKSYSSKAYRVYNACQWALDIGKSKRTPSRGGGV